ncbi:MAG: hypothetical protein C4533_06270 [Candidatus Omnitrophota bacterium]|jgi:type II secretory pathway component PulM|nr:MAG: hypothetical protein C4533_06270 [Candidatus Omnitrophota bacterium]
MKNINFKIKWLSLNEAQKKIAVVLMVFIIIILVLWITIYRPLRIKELNLGLELKALNAQIAQIESIFGSDASIDEGMLRIKKASEAALDKLPADEKDSIRMLSDVARKHNIEIISIKPQPKSLVLDKDRKEIQAEGKTCHSIFVSIDMISSFSDLVAYLAVLENEFKTFITVEELAINRLELSGAKLPVILSINLYLLS